jgi:hypothetical protein
MHADAAGGHGLRRGLMEMIERARLCIKPVSAVTDTSSRPSIMPWDPAGDVHISSGQPSHKILPPLLVLALAHCSRARGMGSAAGGSDGWNGRMDGRMHAGNHAAPPGKGLGGLLTHRGTEHTPSSIASTHCHLAS